MQLPPAPAAPFFHHRDPCERIKPSEVPKFDGKKKAEAWVIEFKKHCGLMRLRTDEDILLAMDLAMMDKAALW